MGVFRVSRVPSTWREASGGEEALPLHRLRSGTVQMPALNHSPWPGVEKNASLQAPELRPELMILAL